MERRTINPWTWQENFGYHQGHEVTGAGRTLWISGQTSTDADGNVVNGNDMGGQVRQALDNVEAVLTGAGMTPANLVRIQILTTDIDLFFQHMYKLNRFVDAGSQHASTVMGVVRLATPEILVEIEATAVAFPNASPLTGHHMDTQHTAAQASYEKRTNLVFGILLSGFMATVFAGLFPLIALGFTTEWLIAWGTGILIGWPLGVGLVSAANKPLMKLAVRLTHSTAG